MRSASVGVLSLALFVFISAFAWGDCPYNGGFEHLDKGLPVGWEPHGTWLSVSSGAYEGTRAVCLAAPVGRAGDRLVSQGYRLVSLGETLALRVAFVAPGGGAVIGLLPCSALGQPLSGEAITVALPEADTWQATECNVSLTKRECPAATAAVRIVLGVDRPGREVRYDAVSLTGAAPQAGGSVAPPSIDAPARLNLLRNPGFERKNDGTRPGWTLLGATGTATGGAEPTATGGLTLVAGGSLTAWLSDMTPVDASLPYQCSVELSEAGVGAKRLMAVVRIRDPRDTQVVWTQNARTVENEEESDLTVVLPRLFAAPRAGLAEVAVVMRPGSGESVTLSSVSLRPQPVTLTIRPVAMATDFAKPQDVTIFISAINNTRQGLQPMAYMKVLEGSDQVAYEARRVNIGSQSAAHFPFKPQLTRAGNYHLLVRLMEGGRDLGSATFAFKVVES